MATNAEQGLQTTDVEQRQVVSGETADVSTDNSSSEAAIVVNKTQSIESAKFPGTGRTLSGKVVKQDKGSNKEESPESDGSESAYHSSDQDGDEDEYEEDDGYESDEDSTSAAIVRGGSGSYNLRSPGAIKRKIRDIGVSDDDRSPALRTRRKTIPDYAEDDDDDDEESENNDNDDGDEESE